jgi:ACS family glucarate transporter-like MFS transporter
VAAAPIAKAFHLSPVALGFLFSSFSWTYIIFVVPAGLLVDRLGTRVVAAGAIILWSASSMLSGAAASFSMLVLTRLGLGTGESAMYPTGLRVVREWAPFPERGLATATFNSGSYAGPAFGAVLVAWLVTVLGWRGSFVVTGLLGFAWAAAWLIFFRQPEKAPWLTPAERAKILAERDVDDASRVPESAGLRTIGELLRSPSMWGVALTQGCGVYTQYLFLTWLPNYLQTQRHLTIVKSGLFTALPYAIAVVLAIMLGRASDRALSKTSAKTGGRRNFVICALLVSSVVLLAPYVGSIWLLAALLTVSLTCVCTASATNFALTNDLLRTPSAAGTTFSLVILGGNIFGLLAPIVTGYVIAATGSFTGAFLVAGLLLVAGATISFTLTRKPITAGDPAVVTRRALA